MTSLQDKTLFVTGGTSGMARATVIQAAQSGARVAFVARRADLGNQLMTDLIEDGVADDHIAYYEGDVTDFERLQEIIQDVYDTWGAIDSLFCCAGTHIVGDVVDTSLKDRDDLWKLNVTHMFMTLKCVIPQMQEVGGGSIVLMGSDQTHIAKQNSCIYGATKAAIGQLTKTTALDFAKDNIRANAICPGTIETPQATHNAKKLAKNVYDGDLKAVRRDLAKGQMIERRGTPEEVANVVCFLLSDKSSFMTGALVSVDGGYIAQ